MSYPYPQQQGAAWQPQNNFPPQNGTVGFTQGSATTQGYPPTNSASSYPSAPYPGNLTNPTPYPTNQSNSGLYPQNPSNPALYPNSQPNPSPYPSSQPNPSPYPPSQPNPTLYPSNPASYPSNQSPYPSNQPSYPSNPNPYPPSASPQNQIPSQFLPNHAQYPSGQYPSTQTPYPVSPFPQHQPSPAPNPLSNPGYPVQGQSLYPSTYQTQSPGGVYQQQGLGMKMGRPTVRPAVPFDPRRDAEILRKAMKGLGTDEKALIGVLTKRSNVQRQEIAIAFKSLYGKDLLADLKSETSGKFEDILVALMTPLYEFLAGELYHAMDGIGTNEATIIDIICSASNAEISAIKQMYLRKYNSSLEKDFRGETSGAFQRLLTSLCQGNRIEDLNVDRHAASQDARSLLKAGEKRLGTDESTFNAILCSRSFAQLQQIFVEYHNITGHDFERAIKSEFSGDIKNGLLAVVKCARDKAGFFAERLHDSMVGFGTNDRALIRLIVSRSEIDLHDIKNAYQIRYNKSLAAAVENDTSGDYKRCLIALLSA